MPRTSPIYFFTPGKFPDISDDLAGRKFISAYAFCKFLLILQMIIMLFALLLSINVSAQVTSIHINNEH